MKFIYSVAAKKLCMAFCALFCVSVLTHAQLTAFPGAEGFGKNAIGGRYGSVYHVTNRNNSGAGSLRDALSQPNRIVVFDVAGVIKITERMTVAANIYIAGQTSPGEGITVYGNGWSFSNAHNTICRYMRIRMGNIGTSGADAAGIADGKNMMFDHCSISWGRDETFSINSSTSENITIQNCIISQGLLLHSAGGLIQAPGGITLYRNVYIDNATRNNKIKGINQYVNNIVYNWKSGAYIMGGDSQGESFANAVSNLFVQGPNDGVQPFSVGNSLYHLYENDNLYDNNRNGQLDPYTIPQSEFEGGPDFQANPFGYPALPTLPASSLFSQLLGSAGASLPYRDYADYYVINELKSLGVKGELIAKEDVLPFGAPTSWNLWAGTTRTDTDNDGIPDAWETANGLNPASAADAMQIAANGYSNIENYINSIDDSYSQEYLRAPLNLKQDSATQNTLYLSWFDYTEKEQGYIVERKVDGVFTQIGTTAANVNVFAIGGLQPEEKDTFRVRAFYASVESGNSNELIAKTKPVEVPVLDPNSFIPDLTWTGSVDQNWDKTTQNWIDNTSNTALFTDSSKLLFAEAGAPGQTINIATQMGPKDMLVNSAGDYAFAGAGMIAGTGSLNKIGTGSLTLNNNNNSYTGATVLHNGSIQFSQLANGGVASSIGASANYGFNWVWKGGTWNYTGGSTSTDRNAVIDQSTTFAVNNAGSAVTFYGVLSGAGGLIKSGPGKLILRSANFYEGETIIRGGVLEVLPISASTEAEDIIHNGVALGTSNVLRLEGGTFRTSGGSTTIYENYPMHIHVKEGTVNGFEPYRNANLAMAVSGDGILNYPITYSRELIQGDWSAFTGQLIANGIGTGTGGERSMLMIDNGVGLPNTRVNATGNTKISNYQNEQTLYLGGLSGTSTTTLSCGNRLAGGANTWSVGAANSNETFHGVINNEAYNSASAFGTTSIIKEGDGVWRLTNSNNNYSGTTTITAGALVVNGNNTGAGAIIVEAGALAGTGSVTGAVTVTGGALEPGDSSVGTFTMKGNCSLADGSVNIDINKTNASWDKLNVNGNLAYGGTLRLQITGILSSGDAFKIFTIGGTASGDFSSIEPATPGDGLQWRFTAATGILQVVEPGFVQGPTNLSLSPGIITNPVPSLFINLSWQDNSDNELHFVIERSTDGVNFAAVAQAAADATSYTDNNGLQEDTKYYYRVKAVGDTKESLYTSIQHATTTSLTAKPEKPASPIPANNTQHLVLSAGKTTLSWTGSGNTVNYEVYLGTDTASLVKLADVPYSANALYETGILQPNTWYYWRVDASNTNGITIGNTWAFKTSGIPLSQSGDYRSRASGNWGTSTVATAIWETFDGSNWAQTATIPGSGTQTVTIRNGHTVTLNATTGVNNLVVENGGTLKSGGDGAGGAVANRNLRIRNTASNFGIIGSSGTANEKVNIECEKANGNVILSGPNTYYLVNFSVHSAAEKLDILIDANLNLTGFMRSFGTTTPSTPSQNDDDVTITVAKGKTVTLTSSGGYLQFPSSGAINTVAQFGKYTYNIDGLLDMRSTGTSCIVASRDLPNSKTTINVSGSWYTGNAMRLMSDGTTVPKGQVAFNIIGDGVVDAGIRGTSTNLVQYDSDTKLVAYFNMEDNGKLKNRVANANTTYFIGSGGTYSPMILNNSGTADIIAVGVKSSIDYVAPEPARVIEKQFVIVPNTPASTNLTVSLGWLPASHASGFDPSKPIVINRYDGNKWMQSTASISGIGSIESPYYARAAGFTEFSSFMVANTPILEAVATTTSDYHGFGVSCYGSSNGAATVQASGGTPPYNYAWSNGETSASAVALPAGENQVTVTDALGFAESASVTISSPDALVVNAEASSNYHGFAITCFRAADGSAAATVSGGTGVYTYNWPTGATTTGINLLTAGAYPVTVTDENGCEAIDTAVLTSPELVTANATVVSNYNGYAVRCFGGTDGSAEAFAHGGTGVYTYLWSNGATTQAAAGLNAGSYQVTITDQNGCIAQAATSLNQPQALSITAGINKTVYFGFPDSACAALSYAGETGGVGPYSMQWNTGSQNRSITVCPQTSTTNQVTITDANGCSFTDEARVCMIDVRCGPKQEKVTVCHSNKNMCVSIAEAKTHLAHGDQLGACGIERTCSDNSRLIANNEMKAASQSVEAKISLSAYPNPFNSNAMISFASPKAGTARLSMIDATGKQLAVLFNGHVDSNETKQVRVQAGSFSSGMYIVQLVTSDGSKHNLKLMLAK